MIRLLLVCLLIAVAGCGGEGAWDKTAISNTARIFSKTISPGAPSTLTLGDKLGPGCNPWADSASPMNAPARSGAKLPVGTMSGPEVIVGSLAVFVDAAMGVTLAIDLETNQERWRLSGSNSFAASFVFTDRTTLCGVATVPNSNSAELQCVVLATGAVKWRRTLPLWLTQAQGQGYGLQGEFVIRDGALFILGGGQVGSYSLETGAQNWSIPAAAHHRSLIFVGSDLVVDGAKTTCITGNSCMRALNPATGATVAEYAAESASFLWADATNAFFHTPVTGAGRSVVKYDSSTHQFTEDTALTASLEGAPGFLDFNGMQRLGGVTDLLPSGKVFLTLASGQEATGATRLCRYTVATRKMDWCLPGTSSITHLRVHPNALFVSNQSFTVLPPEPSTMTAVTDARFYFGRWAFNLGDVYAFR